MLEFNLYNGMLLEYTEKTNRSIKSHIPYNWFWIILRIYEFWWKMDQLEMELSCEQAPSRPSSEINNIKQKSSCWGLILCPKNDHLAPFLWHDDASERFVHF